VIGRIGKVVAVLPAMLVLLAGAASADEPAGARFAYTEIGESPNRLEVRTLGPVGFDPRTIAGGRSGKDGPFPFFLQPPSWSGDGTHLTFAGIGRKGPEREPIEIFVVGSDGSGLRRVPGTAEGSGPVFSPDGRTIAFARTKRRARPTGHGGERETYRSTAVWLADLATGKARRLTPLRNGLEIEPSSFTPDGASLATVRRKDKHSKPEIVIVDLAGGSSKVLASNATDAVYSPDGSQVAYLQLVTSQFRKGNTAGIETSTDLFAMRADGTESRRLTNSRRGAELWPSWDPSGQRISFTRLRGLHDEDSIFGFGDSILQINADGSCQSKLLVGDLGTAYYGGAWQPGPGREAGPIAC
jgi:Tol biopolymer transport system component